ncbi:MAG: cobalamin-binding protein, partial [Pyrinomonadaceae bacterium]
AVIAAFGCRGVEVASPVFETRQVRDDLGRDVKVPVKIDRAISLAPSLTEMIFAVGAGDKLVGVTTYCNYPAETAAIEKVGDTQTPNIEKIIALRPQIVFVSTASQLEAFMNTLDEQGISVYVTNPKSLDGVFENLQRLGELFGTSDKARRTILDLEGRASIVYNGFSRIGPGASRATIGSPRVFMQISRDPLFTIGKESFLTELIDKAGGRSVTRDLATAYPKISKETALALDPEVIILSDSEDNREPSEVLKNSPAVKNNRVFRINADIISRPGPRLVDALEEIAKDLQPAN